MVKLGELNWVVQVKNASEAKKKAKQVENGVGKTKKKVEEADRSTQRYESTLGKLKSRLDVVGEEFDEVSAKADFLYGNLKDVFGTISDMDLGGGGGAGLLGSLLGGGLTGGAIKAASLITGTVSAAALITGSVAAAALIVGTVATDSLIGGVLSAGALIAGTVAAGSLIVGTLAAAALIVGTVATDSLIVGTLAAASLIVGTIAAGSLIVGTIAAGSLIVGTVGIQELIDIAGGGKGIEPVYEAGQDFAKDNPGIAETIHTGFTKNPIYDLGNMVGQAWRGKTGRATGPGTNYVPGAQTGGMVEESGIARIHKGEAIIPESAVNQSGGGATIENISVEIGDQSLNLDNMTPREIRNLAQTISDEIGDQVVDNL